MLMVSDHVQSCSTNTEIIPLSLLLSLKLNIGIGPPVAELWLIPHFHTHSQN